MSVWNFHDSEHGPPSYVTATPEDRVRCPSSRKAGGFFSFQAQSSKRKRHATHAGSEEDDAVREVHAVPAASAFAARSAMAEPVDRARAGVVLGRPARRQPGADRPDGSR